MTDILVERFQVCLGSGPQDPAPSIAIDDVLTRAVAQGLADQLVSAARAGGFDQDTIGTRTFYVRNKPGQQIETLAVVADATGIPTRAEIEAIADQQTSIVVFARHLTPAGFVRLGTLPVADLRRLSA